MEHYQLWKDYQNLHIEHPDPASAAKVDYYSANSDAIKAHNSQKSHKAAIIIPAYNEQLLLPRALASINGILRNISKPVSTIVVDNASTDLTAEIAKEFGAQLVGEPKKGIGQARQTGLEATTPNMAHIFTTDSDTVVPPNWINDHLTAISRSEITLSYRECALLSDFGGTFMQIQLLSAYQQAAWINRWIKRNINKPNTGGYNMCFKREAAFYIGGYNTELGAGEDLDITRKLADLGKVERVRTSALVSARRVLAKGIIRQFLERTHANVQHSLTDTGMKHTNYDDYRINTPTIK